MPCNHFHSRTIRTVHPGKEKVLVLTYHKPLMNILKKSIFTSTKCLQRLRLRLQKYALEIKYKPGPQMYISDTLSRVSLPIWEVKANTPEYVLFQIVEEQAYWEEIEEVCRDEVTDERLQDIRLLTSKDNTLQVLMNAIQQQCNLFVLNQRVASWVLSYYRFWSVLFCHI